MSRLEEIVPELLWVAGMPLRFYGIQVGTRMTVCRLSDGTLWLHSPIRLDEDLKSELYRLGPIRFAVAPNKLHHLFVGDYFAAYPEAKIFASPGLTEKRSDLLFHGVLADTPEPEWTGDIDQEIFRGEHQLEEVVFLHRESRTLITADLLQSGHPDSAPLTRLVTRLNGTYEHPGPPLAIKLGFRDKTAAKTSAERVLSWDFDRVILAHGRIIETGGKTIFREAYSFLS